MENECPVCGKPARIEETQFELRAFVFRGGASEGQIGISVIPEGMKVMKCFTNEGCGEMTLGGEEAVHMDAATLKVHQTLPQLKALLETARKATFVGKIENKR